MKLSHCFLLLLASCTSHKLPVIVYSEKATPTERYAARELGRYIYLRTGSLPEMKMVKTFNDFTDRYIIISSRQNMHLFPQFYKQVTDSVNSLNPGDFYLHSTDKGLIISGGGDSATLHGVYHFLNDKLNIGLYPHGQVIPDGRTRNISIEGYNKVFRRVNTTRGTILYHNFPESPYMWGLDGYKPVALQLASTTINKTAADFYKQWCFVQFGSSIATDAAAIFASIDGEMAHSPAWHSDPEIIKPIATHWEQVQAKYDFVEKFANLLLPVKGRGNLERYKYWMNRFKLQKTIAQMGCTLYQYNKAIAKAHAANSPETAKTIAVSEALPLRAKLMQLWEEARLYHLESSSVFNDVESFLNPTTTQPRGWAQNDSLLFAIVGHGAGVAKTALGYNGKLRVFVAEPQNSRVPGEPIKLKIIILGVHDASKSLVYIKQMGAATPYTTHPLKRIGRELYEVILPANELGNNDVEYYVYVAGKGEWATFPVTAPEINQTVVVGEKGESCLSD